MTGRFTGEEMLFVTLVLPSLNRNLRITYHHQYVGEITQERRFFLYSRSPLSEPEIVGVFTPQLDVGEITQERRKL